MFKYNKYGKSRNFASYKGRKNSYVRSNKYFGLSNRIRSLPREIQQIIFSKYLQGLHKRSRIARAKRVYPKGFYKPNSSYAWSRTKKLMK